MIDFSKAIQAIEADDFTHSASKIRCFNDAPVRLLEYQAAKMGLIEKAETNAMRFGSFSHCLYFEPHEVENRYIVLKNKIDRRRNADITGEDGELLLGKDSATALEQQARSQGKEIVSAADYKKAQEIVSYLRNSATCERLYKRAEGFEKPFEVIIKHNDKPYKFRGVIDMYTDRDIIDLKNISDLVVRKAKWQILDANIDIQLALYYLAEIERTGVEKTLWIFAVNKTGVLPIKISLETVESGIKKIHKYIDDFERCKMFSDWCSGVEFHLENGYLEI